MTHTKKHLVKIIKEIILGIVVIFITLIIIGYFTPDNGTSQNDNKNTKLNNPDLLYSSRFWAGLCGNDKGEDGGCYTEFYLYNSGKLVKDEGFVKYLTNKKEVETTEKQLNQNFIDEIKSEINNSGIIVRSCAPETIYDVGWDYQINVNGLKKSFRNPPPHCKDIFDKIDNLLNDELITASSTVVSQIDVNNLTDDLQNVKFVYSTDNGSLPPPYHRKSVLTISELDGSVIAESVISDYKNVLEKKKVNITADQFGDLVNRALKLETEDTSLNDGCTGGTNKSVKITKGNEILIETSNYNCAGISTNKSLLNFSMEIEQLISQNDSVSCVTEGGSLGAVIQGNNIECCAGLVHSDVSKIAGNRGTCVKP